MILVLLVHTASGLLLLLKRAYQIFHIKGKNGKVLDRGGRLLKKGFTQRLSIPGGFESVESQPGVGLGQIYGLAHYISAQQARLVKSEYSLAIADV